MNTITRSRIYLSMAAMVLTAALVVTATARVTPHHTIGRWERHRNWYPSR